MYLMKFTTCLSLFAQIFLQTALSGSSIAQLPDVKRILPMGVTRGVKSTLTFEGHNLKDLSFFLSGAPFKTGPFQYTVDGKSAKIDLTFDPLVLPGPVQVRIANRFGASQTKLLWVDVLPTRLRGPEESITIDQFPIALDGVLASNADRQVTKFNVTVGDIWVFDVVAGRMGSPSSPRIDLLDSTGKVVETATTDGIADARIIHKFSESGVYQIATSSATSKPISNAPYRLSLGKLPVLTSFIPHGERPGRTILMGIDGKNIGGALKGNLPIPKTAEDGEIFGTVRTPNGFTLPFPFLVDADPVASITETDAVMPLPFLPGSLEGAFLVYPRTKFFFNAGPKEPIAFDFFASKISSVIEGELEIQNESGMRLALSRAAHGQDAHLEFQPEVASTYTLIASNLTGKIGSDCTYRIKASIPLQDFRVNVGTDKVSLSPGGAVIIPIHIDRLRGFSQTVAISTRDLPSGVVSNPIVIAPGEVEGQLKLTASPSANIRIAPIKFVGTATIGGLQVVRSGILPKSTNEINPSKLFLLIVSPEEGRK